MIFTSAYNLGSLEIQGYPNSVMWCNSFIWIVCARHTFRVALKFTEQILIKNVCYNVTERNGYVRWSITNYWDIDVVKYNCKNIIPNPFIFVV